MQRYDVTCLPASTLIHAPLNSNNFGKYSAATSPRPLTKHQTAANAKRPGIGIRSSQRTTPVSRLTGWPSWSRVTVHPLTEVRMRPTVREFHPSAKPVDFHGARKTIRFDTV